MLWTFIPFFIVKIVVIIPVAGFALALAFYKVNNRSFVAILESVFKYFMNSKLYIWKKKEKLPEHKEKEGEDEPLLSVPKLSDSKLKDLTWSLDINESISPGAKETMQK